MCHPIAKQVSPVGNQLFIFTCLKRDQASHVPTKSLKELTNTCLGQAKFENYLSQEQTQWHSSIFQALVSVHEFY